MGKTFCLPEPILAVQRYVEIFYYQNWLIFSVLAGICIIRYFFMEFYVALFNGEL